ncbi:MAG: MBOAT family protein [Anaerolineales bacterium]|nr:MBOAT family protein [Anaerolineales bacterium]
MSISNILTLAAVSLVIGRFRRGRSLAVLASSAMVIYWLQPQDADIVTLVYWIPTATIVLVSLFWAVTSLPDKRSFQENWPAALVLSAVLLLVDLNRYFGFEQVFTVKTPRPILIAAVIVVVFLLSVLLLRFRQLKKLYWISGLAGIILVFLVMKTPNLPGSGVELLLDKAGRPLETGSNIAFSWLGFSYVAFRLMHTIRDRQAGRLPALNLAEYASYVLFFPSFTAGPIDRSERFVKELREPLVMDDEGWLFAGQRLAVGMLVKFVFADMLAILSISDRLVRDVISPGWLWLFLYAYSFRILCDFSGYTHIAIGLGRLMGFRLPENFNWPYLKSNLTQFWNAWHITLTQWFRAYFFNPASRWMRSKRWPVPLIILVMQLSTMTLIGLWHGITWNYALWGLWHGIGLFIQNRWSEFASSRLRWIFSDGRKQRILDIFNIFLTFNYVTLGWVFFTLSEPAIAWLAILRLFNLA